MSFSDVFKSSFLSNINSFSVLDVLLALGLSFMIGLFIFIIYKKTWHQAAEVWEAEVWAGGRGAEPRLPVPAREGGRGEGQG